MVTIEQERNLSADALCRDDRSLYVKEMQSCIISGHKFPVQLSSETIKLRMGLLLKVIDHEMSRLEHEPELLQNDRWLAEVEECCYTYERMERARQIAVRKGW